MNWGRIHQSAFTGSMAGSGANAYAVWSYILAHAWDGLVTINPKVVASVIGMTTQEVEEVLEVFMAPDPSSQSQKEDGRRLVRLHGVRYSLPNWFYYNGVMELEERREKDRERQAKSRAAKKEREDSERASQATRDVSHQSCDVSQNVTAILEQSRLEHIKSDQLQSNSKATQIKPKPNSNSNQDADVEHNSQQRECEQELDDGIPWK